MPLGFTRKPIGFDTSHVERGYRSRKVSIALFQWTRRLQSYLQAFITVKFILNPLLLHKLHPLAKDIHLNAICMSNRGIIKDISFHPGAAKQFPKTKSRGYHVITIFLDLLPIRIPVLDGIHGILPIPGNGTGKSYRYPINWQRASLLIIHQHKKSVSLKLNSMGADVLHTHKDGKEDISHGSVGTAISLRTEGYYQAIRPHNGKNGLRLNSLPGLAGSA